MIGRARPKSSKARRELSRGLVIFARPGQIRYSRFHFRSSFIYFDAEPHPELDALLARIPDFSPPDALDEAAISARRADFRACFAEASA